MISEKVGVSLKKWNDRLKPRYLKLLTAFIQDQTYCAEESRTEKNSLALPSKIGNSSTTELSI